MSKPLPPANSMMGVAFFREGNWGWSEVYYLKTTDYDQAITDMGVLMTDRMSLANDDVFNDFIRVSKMDVTGDSLVANGKGAGTFGLTNGSLPAYAALPIRKEGGTLYRSVTYLRGLPLDGIVDHAWVDPAGWHANYLTWAADVKALTQLCPKPRGTTQQIKVSITAVVQGLITERQVGRPFGLHHGRHPI